MPTLMAGNASPLAGGFGARTAFPQPVFCLIFLMFGGGGIKANVSYSFVKRVKELWDIMWVFEMYYELVGQRMKNMES